MFDILNRFAHGFTASPVVEACRRRGLIPLLSAPQPFHQITGQLRANPGYLRVALRLLESLGVVACENGLYRIADGELINSFPDSTQELYDGTLAPDRLRAAIEQSLHLATLASPEVRDLLDGPTCTPLLLRLARQPRLDNVLSLDGIEPELHSPIGRMFASRQWGRAEGDSISLNAAGQFLLERAPILSTVYSYRPMLRRMDDLLFGDAAAVFQRDSLGHETHVDRTLNVTGSGFQHEKYFAQLDEIITDIFNREPLEEQPHFVADMGCGDGALLRRIYETVRTSTRRGAALDRLPLRMIGLDFNARALEAADRTLAGIPRLMMRADIGDPASILSEFERRGIPAGDVLHVRSFLDHDRPFVAPDSGEAVAERERTAGASVSVGAHGEWIPAAAVEESLVRHLRQWRHAVNRHGLLLLEVHCLSATLARRYAGESESLHFDAYHGFSRQHLVEAHVFLLALAEAGLFPRPGFSRRFPRTFPFTRITLDWLEKQDCSVRYARPADLAALVELEAQCWPEGLRTPEAELRDRMLRFPQGQFVLEADGRVAAALYSQRIASVEVLDDAVYADLAKLHTPGGAVLQLLGLVVAPDQQDRNYGRRLADTVTRWCELRGDLQRIAGVTRCKEYQGGSYEAYVRQTEGGLPVDPILKFHVGRGASIRTIVPGYRPEDTANLGHGVVIEYALDAAPTSAPAPARRSESGVLQGVIEAVQRLLNQQRRGGFHPEIPLRDLGFDSLDLMELRSLLNQRFGVALDSSFFFEYPSAAAIAAFLEGTSPSPPPPVEPIRAPGTGAAVEADPDRNAVALIGMACRLPGGVETPEDFWKLLERGEVVDARVPAERWSEASVRHAPGAQFGAFLSDVDRFDAAFFRIAPREANFMDPAQRLLLEQSWRALENAGIAPDSLARQNVGVFTGVFSHDYEILSLRRGAVREPQPYLATGNSASVASGRVAYFLDLRGPALTIDTACSSSLAALHLACRSLQSGECRLALVGGVNLMLTPELSVTFAEAGMLSKHGRCNTFDASADGYVRAEGCVAVVLKPLSEALRDGDEVMAVIRGTAMNQDGASNGLTAPNAQAQEAVIRQALAAAGCAPNEVSYVEAHGTGTPLGDPVEVKALGAVYGEGRTDPLLLGSAKANLGHTEAAAGLVGLLKVALSLRHGKVPAHPGFQKINPEIRLEPIHAKIPVTAEPWEPGASGRRLAGLSSFGFSGTNVHAVIEEAPLLAPTSPPRAWNVLALSAASETALRQTVSSYAAHLRQNPDVPVADVCTTANAGRRHFDFRWAAVGDSRESLLAALNDSSQGREVAHPPKIAFLYSGQGSQYAGMGRQLYQTNACFRDAIHRCADLLDAPLLELLYGSQSHNLAETRFTQPALFCLQYALTQVWRSWGIEPAAVAGHSAGEFAAAVAAGVLSLEDGLSLIAERARRMQEAPRGAMLAVLADAATVEAAVRGLETEAVAAVYNAPQNIVISGEGARIEELERRFERQGIRTVRLNVSHAFHSPLMDQAIAPLVTAARAFGHAAPSVPFVSNLDGQFRASLDAEYWGLHLRNPVRFSQGVRTLLDWGCDAFLEIGPKPVLIDLGRQCDAGEQPRLWTPSLRQGRDDWRQMLESVRDLYLRGARIQWAAVEADNGRRRSGLPGYPFEKTRHWLPEQTLLGARLSSPLPGAQFESCWREANEVFRDHRVDGAALAPMAVFLEQLRAAAVESGRGGAAVSGLEIETPVAFPASGSLTVQTIHSQDGECAIHSREEDGSWRKHCAARLTTEKAASNHPTLASIQQRLRAEADVPRFYQSCAEAGVEYGGAYRRLQRLFVGSHEALGHIAAPGHPAVLLDAALQVALAALPDGLAAGVPLPISAAHFQMQAPLPARFWSYARTASSGAHHVTADVFLFDEAGTVLGSVEGLTLRYRAPKKLLYQVEWTPAGSRAAEAVNGLAAPFIEAAFSELRQSGGMVLPRHRALYRRLEQIVANAGGAASPATLQEVRNAHPEAAPELALLERCGANLAGVLTGRCDPLELLFPSGDIADCRRLYLESPAFAEMNRLVRQQVLRLAAATPEGRTLRILEIGGGTAATTESLLPHLPPEKTSYVFTDVSSLFPALAADRFRDYSFVTYRTLDIEKDLEAQGFEAGSFDVVLASNVLHATADLASSLRRARQLLTKDGSLILVEVTEPQPWIDLTFGLTEGWWRFTDHDLRPSYPLLSPAQWRDLFHREGFAACSTTSANGQSLIVGRMPFARPAHWTLTGDRTAGAGLAALLARNGGHCEWADPNRVGQTDGVIHFANAEEPWRDVLRLAQVLPALQPCPPVWLVTTQALAVLPADRVAGVQQSTVWGVGKVWAHEQPELRCCLIDVDGAESSLEALAEAVQGAAEPAEESAIRNGVRYVSRLVRWDPDSEAAPLPSIPNARRAPGPGEVEIRVAATGLNFRDVLSILGLYPGDPGPLGVECSGIVERVGPGVEGLSEGSRVFAMAPGAFGEYVTAPADSVARVPDNLSLLTAAGAAVPFLTAAYALEELAAIQPGERVLVHAAAGGVGLAACQIAARNGAEVYAIASRGKWEFLRQQGVRRIYDSRSTEFADEIRAAGGVDVVLNSLSGDASRRSYELLNEGGRFIEIGKNSVISPEAPGYFAFDLLEVAAKQPKRIQKLLQAIAHGLESGSLRPLPTTVYPLAKASQAVEQMRQSRHQGKIVIAHPVPRFDPQGVFLITGGSSGLGLAFARWLAERGVRHLVLTSRREPGAHAQQVAEDLRRQGASVSFHRADAGCMDQMKAVFESIAASGRAVRGVIHSAGVLDDGLLTALTPERFETVLRPKAQGAWNLHQLTQNLGLDLFILFSSMASVLGSPGQANHAAANAFLDSLAGHRRAMGLPALSVNWGAWSQIGSAAGEGVREHLRRLGLQAITPSEGLAAFEQVLNSATFRACVARMDWDRFLSGRQQSSFFEGTRSAEVRPEPPASFSLQDLLSEPSAERRHTLLRQELGALLKNVLGMKPEAPVSPKRGFFELGLDSLGSVQLRNSMQKLLGRQLPAGLLFDHPSLEALTGHLLRNVLRQDEVRTTPPLAADRVEIQSDIHSLTEEEAEKALLERLERIGPVLAE